jgi:acetyltransferase-like isoleucine patch superfamily enzyme
MDAELVNLHQQLVQLYHALRAETFRKYHRINPFYEDLFDWKERGEFFFGAGKNITVYNTCTIVGNVEVGEHTWIGPYTSLDGTGGLAIGKFCSISVAVHILTHDTVKWALTGGKAKYEYAPVKVGDCCFIGIGTVITKGVTVGDHCVIGAGAVVTKDIPAYSIAAGVPARVIGQVKIDGENVVFEYCKSIDQEP